MNGRRAAITGLLLAVALTAIAYRHLPTGYFVRDDWDWLEIAARSQTRPGLILERHLDPFNYHVFRPVPMAAFAILYRTVGLEPSGYYLTNITLHLVNTGLVWALAGSLGLGGLGQAAAAGAFGLNWGHREAVLQIHILQTLLCTGFSLAAALCWLRFTRNGRWAWYGGTVLAGLLALLSQEFAAVLPLALIAVEYGATGRASRWREALLLWAPMAPALGRLLLGRGDDPLLTGAAYGLGLHAPRNLLAGLADLALPQLGHTASGAEEPGLPPWPALAAAGLAAAGLLWRGGPVSRAGLAWAVLGLLPTIPFHYPPASRYLYLPFVGAALLLGRAADRIAAAAAGRGARLAVGGLGLLWATLNLLALHHSTLRMVGRGEDIRRVIRQVRGAVPAPAPGSVIHLLHTPSPEFNLSKQRVSRLFRFVYGAGVTVEERSPETWMSVPRPGPGRYVVRLEGDRARLIPPAGRLPWRSK